MLLIFFDRELAEHHAKHSISFRDAIKLASFEVFGTSPSEP